ncbi:fumarylacetoacetate hydrolase family protein [Enemella sp. A6]|uniref:fumarylacetoacetate hydrolase family protein n=1 Tax=Enemella sp. A6 TaxID=3440152 RepID=UPI003EBD2377
MQLLSFSRQGSSDVSWGVRLGEGRVLDVPAADPQAPATLFDHVSDNGAYDVAGLMQRADELSDAVLNESDLTLRAPLRPGKIVGVGLNYVEHVEESSRSLDTDEELPPRPVLFGTPGTAVIGDQEAIRHNAEMTSMLDWECELAVVIGTVTNYDLTEEDALNHVFGYSICNDISARDQRRSQRWFFSKGQDTYKPFGPVLVTADEIGDPHDLELKLTVNGQQMQHGNTKNMLFKIPTLIADLASGMTMEPGDMIATGSPMGVGAAMDPPQFLQPGDVVEATIEKIGTLTNPVQAV